MITLGLGLGMAGSPARDSVAKFGTCGSQQQPAGSATFSDVLRSGSSAEPQPHPSLPSALASASAAQQASTLAGAGPPQQPDDAAATGARLVEHTPVSGRTRRVSSAASRSPARAATTERTCS